MRAIEVNFDGLIGPTHNYAGLSFGNVAATANAGAVSAPRAAALQGLEKMRRLIRLGFTQGLLPPHERPNPATLAALGFRGDPDAMAAALWRDDPALFAAAFSASAMWTANAATISPSADCADGRLHASVANLAAMPHRAFEPPETLRQLAALFTYAGHFTVHAALPGGVHFGDEGAANHMRLAPAHGDPGVEVFVYGAATQRFPARQKRRAGEAIARRHQLDPARVVHLEQSETAIEAGAFHNDVVAVANENVLFVHALAFTDQPAALARLQDAAPFLRVIEAPVEAVSLEDAVTSYLFNSQLLTAPNGAAPILLAPEEVRENPAVNRYLEGLLAEGALSRVEIVGVRESMRNGGGPACLRLRVVLTEQERAAINERFMLTEPKIDQLQAVIERHWPEAIAPADLGDPALWAETRAARAALMQALGF